jgi:hypothetical protein
MITRSIIWISIAALLVAIFARSAGYPLLLQIVISIGALWVIVQAVRTGRYIWAGAFGVIAALYNPILPVALPTFLSFAVGVICLWAFGASLLMLKATEMASLASVTGRSHRRRFSSPGQWNVVS